MISRWVLKVLRWVQVAFWPREMFLDFLAEDMATLAIQVDANTRALARLQGYVLRKDREREG